MPDYPFDPQPGRRRTMEEAARWVEQTYGYTLVNGCQTVLAAAGVQHNTRRVASFGEFTPYEAWYLNQAATGGYLRWATAPVPAGNAPDVVFLLSIGLGNGSALPQPTGRFDLFVDESFVASLRVVKNSETWQTTAGTVHYDMHRLETAPPGQSLILDAVLREESFASFGLLFVRVPRARLHAGQAATITVRAFNRAPSTRWFKLDQGNNVRFHSNFYPGLTTLAQGRTAPRLGEYRVFWGDIHSHSGEAGAGLGTCGTGTVDENYAYARDVSNLDFYALSEHDWQTDAAHWATLMHKVEEYNAPGRFATIPAFEWTSLVYGHRNVYYADAHEPFFLSWQEALAGAGRRPMGPDVDSPLDLWRKLDALGCFALTVPHHPPVTSHPLNWDFYHPRYDRLVEIYSSWGSSEYSENRYKGVNADHYPHLYVRHALNRGRRLGFVAAGDGHDGHPGNAQSPDDKHHHLYHYLGSGRTAVLAPELSRAAVLDALYDRRCYAVTGAPILLDFRLSGHLMGRELTPAQAGARPHLTATVEGTTHLTRVEIVKNGRLAWRAECLEEDYNRHTLDWVDEQFDPAHENYYYCKVSQRDGEMAWASPIWISPR
jgi:hypothetical protein